MLESQLTARHLDLAVATGEAYNGYYEQNLIFFNHDGQLEATASWRSTIHDACYDAKFVDWDLDGDIDLLMKWQGGALQLAWQENVEGEFGDFGANRKHGQQSKSNVY